MCVSKDSIHISGQQENKQKCLTFKKEKGKSFGYKKVKDFCFFTLLFLDSIIVEIVESAKYTMMNPKISENRIFDRMNVTDEQQQQHKPF